MIMQVAGSSELSKRLSDVLVDAGYTPYEEEDREGNGHVYVYLNGDTGQLDHFLQLVEELYGEDLIEEEMFDRAMAQADENNWMYLLVPFGQPSSPAWGHRIGLLIPSDDARAVVELLSE